MFPGHFGDEVARWLAGGRDGAGGLGASIPFLDLFRSQVGCFQVTGAALSVERLVPLFFLRLLQGTGSEKGQTDLVRVHCTARPGTCILTVRVGAFLFQVFSLGTGGTKVGSPHQYQGCSSGGFAQWIRPLGGIWEVSFFPGSILGT